MPDSPSQPIFIDETPPGESPKPDSSPLPEPSKKPKKERRKKRKEKPVDALKGIYEEGGKMPDLTKLERARRSPRAILVGLVLFFAVLAAAAWAGFFIFKPYSRFDGRGPTLAIEGPGEVKAGERVRYEFRYKNTERVDLASLELRLVMPKTFTIIEATPAATTAPATWTLGNLGRGASGSIRIDGYFLGPGEGTTAFQSIATYRPANFNSDFQAITTRQITLKGTVLDAALTGPNEIAPGEAGEYIYTVKNTGSEPLANLEAVFEAPNTFLLASAEPASADERAGRWPVSQLEPGAEFTVKIRGSFSASASGRTELAMSIGVVENDGRLVHRRDTFATDVLASEVQLGLIVNGSAGDTNANFGDTLNVTLTYKNTGSFALGDVTVSVTAATDPGGLIDWNAIETGSPARVAPGTITWTKRELAALGTIAGGAEGSFDLTLPIVKTPPGTRGADEIRIAGTMLITSVGGRVAARTIQTTPIIVRLNSDLTFSAEARYFDANGASQGSGPLPPRVGETTTLRIVWNLANTRHPLENVRVRTTLPGRVTWVGRSRSDLGTVSWDEASRAVVLTIDSLPTSVGSLTADFDVQITPAASDAGTFMTLTQETTLSARDTVTGSVLSRRADPLTTDMQTDTQAKNKGAVVD